MREGGLLRVMDLRARYGESRVLHGMTFQVGLGEVITLVGRNGAGKTSTMRAIMGLIAHREGSVAFDDRETIALTPDAVARLGIGYCPEERGIFASLNVYENLVLPPVLARGGLDGSRIDTLFPRLRERYRTQGTKLSGGEQQMLAIARVLRTGARLLLLDEPTEGLAPVIVQRIGELIKMLRGAGFTILLVEQNARFAAAVADRQYVVEHGRVVDEIVGSDSSAGARRLSAYLAV